MNELEWLDDQRPEVDEDPVVRVRARRTLLDHVRPRRRSAAPRRAGLVAVAALFAAGMAIAWPTGGPGVPAPIAAPEVAEAAPLVLLSQKIQAEPEPEGDATLVIRHQRYPDGKTIPGYDLYLDDGRYYYGQTKEQLKVAGLTSSTFQKPLIEAAVAAPSLPAAAARQKMRDGLAQGKAPKVDYKGTEDNHIWVGSMDALLAGAGRKDVRAGVMTLLATLDDTEITERGGKLKIAVDGGVENLFLDARTGVPVKFEGGVSGRTPDVVIDYDVKRVTAATWADAAAEDAAGQVPAVDADRPELPARPEDPPGRKG